MDTETCAFCGTGGRCRFVLTDDSDGSSQNTCGDCYTGLRAYADRTLLDWPLTALTATAESTAGEER